MRLADWREYGFPNIYICRPLFHLFKKICGINSQRVTFWSAYLFILEDVKIWIRVAFVRSADQLKNSYNKLSFYQETKTSFVTDSGRFNDCRTYRSVNGQRSRERVISPFDLLRVTTTQPQHIILVLLLLLIYIWDSSVSTATGYGRRSIPGTGKIFFCTQSSGRLWGPPSFPSSEYRRLFPRG
jgi:hypothetical protein